MNDPTDLLGGTLTPPVTDTCPRCGGQGLEPCNACMDTGIGGDGGDCRECPVPGTPCAACSPDVCPSCGLDDDHTPSCDRKPRTFVATVRLTDDVKEPHLRGALGRVILQESNPPNSWIVELEDGSRCQLGPWELEPLEPSAGGAIVEHPDQVAADLAAPATSAACCAAHADGAPMGDPCKLGPPPAVELPAHAGELDELWQHLGDAIRALGSLTPEHIDAMADELNYGELADLFLDAKAMADTIKAVEGRAKDLLLTEARRRFDEDGTATKWKRDRGTVSLAVPDTPKPYVRDPGALIAWLEANGMDTLVDRDPRPDPKALDALAKSGTVTDTGIFVADGDGTPVDGVGCRPPGSPYLSRRSS